MDVTEGSRAMLGYLVEYMDVTEGSRAKLGCPVRFMDITEGSRAGPGYPVGYTGTLNLALEPSVTSMYPTGHPSLAQDPW
jgi:hypothetical protein